MDFFDSHMQNYIAKLKIIKWNRFDTMNELFSPAGLDSQVLYGMQDGGISLIKRFFGYACTNID